LVGGLALGHDFDSGFGLEAQISYRSIGLAGETVDGSPISLSGTLDSAALMVNARYAFAPENSVRPYFGVGAGLTWMSLDALAASSVQVRDADLVGAAQIFGGLEFRLNDDWTLGTELRYFHAGKAILHTAGTISHVDESQTSMLLSLSHAF
jgi:opacity protein-like surface antigen